MKENYEQQSGEALEEKLVGVNRVAKVVKGWKDIWIHGFDSGRRWQGKSRFR